MQTLEVCVIMGMLTAAVSQICHAESDSLVCGQTASFSYPAMLTHNHYVLEIILDYLIFCSSVEILFYLTKDFNAI